MFVLLFLFVLYVCFGIIIIKNTNGYPKIVKIFSMMFLFISYIYFCFCFLVLYSGTHPHIKKGSFLSFLVMDTPIINDIVSSDNEIIEIEFAREGINPPSFQGGWSVSYKTKKNKQQILNLVRQKLSKKKMIVYKAREDYLGDIPKFKNFYVAKNPNPPFEVVELSISENGKGCFVLLSVLLF